MTQQQERRIAWEEYRVDKDNSIDFDDDEDDDEQEEWKDSDIGPRLIMGGQPQQIPKELVSPFKYFKCHKCNTNFNVTPKMIYKIAEVEGVEIIIPLTRYSFIMAVAKLFSESDVKESVKDAILHGEIVK